MVTGWRFVVRLQHRPHTLSQRVQFIIKHIHGEIGESVHLTYEHSTISWQQLVKNNTRKFRIPRLRSISIYLHHGGVVFRGVTAPRVELPEVGRAQRFNLQLYVSLELDSLVSVSRKLEHALAVQHQTCDTSRHVTSPSAVEKNFFDEKFTESVKVGAKFFPKNFRNIWNFSKLGLTFRRASQALYSDFIRTEFYVRLFRFFFVIVNQ